MSPALHKAQIQAGRQAPDRQNLGLYDGRSDGRCQWEGFCGLGLCSCSEATGQAGTS